MTAFNGDSYIEKEVRRLIAKWGVKTIIETGVWACHSSRAFATMGAERVIGIDSTFKHLTEEFGPNAEADVEKLGVTLIQGDSGELLQAILLVEKGPFFLYLDAHGGGDNDCNVNPLFNELDAIGRVPGTYVISVHDCYIPKQPNLGFNQGDWGRGVEPISYKLMADYHKLAPIYPNGHSFHYPAKTEGCNRGILYLEPSEGWGR